MPDPRWLTPEDAAAYIGRHRDELPRLVRIGKVPKPSLHFGPRSPRYDRLALDSLFLGKMPDNDVDSAEAAAVNDILAGKYPGRQKAAR